MAASPAKNALAATSFFACLHGRALHIAIRAINAAIASLGLEDFAASPAIIKPLACIARHFVFRAMTAMGTGECRFRDDGCHLKFNHRSKWPSYSGSI